MTIAGRTNNISCIRGTCLSLWLDEISFTRHLHGVSTRRRCQRTRSVTLKQFTQSFLADRPRSFSLAVELFVVHATPARNQHRSKSVLRIPPRDAPIIFHRSGPQACSEMICHLSWTLLSKPASRWTSDTCLDRSSRSDVPRFRAHTKLKMRGYRFHLSQTQHAAVRCI